MLSVNRKIINEFVAFVRFNVNNPFIMEQMMAACFKITIIITANVAGVHGQRYNQGPLKWVHLCYTGQHDLLMECT